MPEGPSLYLFKEEAASFKGKKIAVAKGNTKTVDLATLAGQRVTALHTWGKHFLIELNQTVLKIHFLLFGSYRINERKDTPPRLSLQFSDGSELNICASSIRELDRETFEAYDFTADVMSPTWDPARARKKLRARPDMLACDALLDQTIFSGVGNIIKNEVLFRIRLHPLSTMGALPAPKLRQLVEQARVYSFDFLEWKKQFVLKKSWLAHAKRTCPRCDLPYTKAHLGLSKRRSFFCEKCQKRYN